VAERVLGFTPKLRHAHYAGFRDADGDRLDQGIALYFKAPHSYTGQDVVEFQAHGGPVVLDLILKTVLKLGCRLAEPGEFSMRAFLNDKIDLVQAEAISDLINSASEQAVRSANRTLDGKFSEQINALVHALIELRKFVEAAIDFPEEEIDFISDSNVVAQLEHLQAQLKTILASANQGALLAEGMRVVIAGRPNAGKSSLLNALSGRDSAIVTDIAGTTRDVLKEQIQIDGMPLHIIDTAGLRQSDDPVEQIGIARAWQEIEQADRILLVFDATRDTPETVQSNWQEFIRRLPHTDHLTLIANKSDLLPEGVLPAFTSPYPILALSAKTGSGIAALKAHLKATVGFDQNVEGSFLARRRHLKALEEALDHVRTGHRQLIHSSAAELLAEDLRQAQEALGRITGKFLADDLLGEIFGNFCIGK
jgi:tRNA modification GTPase